MVFTYKLFGGGSHDGEGGGGRARVTKHKPGSPCACGVDGNQTDCSDHCALYASNQSLCCTSETNIVLYVNYFSIKTRFFLEEEKREQD